jgi:hypothetical protein
MIPLLIIWLLKNFRKIKHVAQKTSIRTTVQLIFMLALLTGFVHAQEKVHRYNILHNGEIKGVLVVHQQVNGSRVRVKIDSEVKTRFLIKVTVKAIEEAIFENGILVYSSLCRIVNGDEKINQQLQVVGISYKITSKSKITTLPNYPIHHSVLSLYYQEPVNVSKIYSDNYQQYVDIKKVENSKYQVIFPNGNINYYSYKNGICTSVEVNQFYNLQFLLTQ